MERRSPDDQPDEGKPGPRQVIGSVLAAAFGVQSSRNRERDFRHGRARHYIVAGILFTVIFGLTVYGLVQLVLKSAGI